MAAPKDFLTGFNHNVRHKGRGYHVQTEDSGEEIAHVITHLFEGGNILASKKTSYAELRGKPDLKPRVRSLMEEQHRQMLRELVNGGFDGGSAASAPADIEVDVAVDFDITVERTGFLPPVQPVQKRGTSQPEAPWIDALAKAAAASAGNEVVPPADAPWAESTARAATSGSDKTEAPWADAMARAAAPTANQPGSGRDPRSAAGPAGERPGAYRGAPTHERTVVPAQRNLDRTPGPFPRDPSLTPGPSVLWPTATEAARFGGSTTAASASPPRGSGTEAVRSAGSSAAVANAHQPDLSAPARPDALSPGPRAAIEPTPGPWRPGAPIETVFGADPGAEKSLDEVILRYLAGERE